MAGGTEAGGTMRVRRRSRISRAGAAVLVVAFSVTSLPAAAWDDARDEFFGSGLEAFTGLRSEDVEEIGDGELDSMRGKFREFYFSFDASGFARAPSAPQDTIEVAGGIFERVEGIPPIVEGGSIGGEFTLRNNVTGDSIRIVDSLNNSNGLFQFTQVVGDNNVVFQNVTINLAIFEASELVANPVRHRLSQINFFGRGRD